VSFHGRHKIVWMTPNFWTEVYMCVYVYGDPGAFLNYYYYFSLECHSILMNFIFVCICLSLPVQSCCQRASGRCQRGVWRAQPCTPRPRWADLQVREDGSQAAGKPRWQGSGIRRAQRWDHRASSPAKAWSPSRSPRSEDPSPAVR